jgi:acyl-coenzyme A synthetase/AMP-(fatty) acid ligase/thioesterase domain-containing protein/acyl carrier protein
VPAVEVYTSLAGDGRECLCHADNVSEGLSDVSAVVRETAADDPNLTALDTGAEQLTYSELNCNADALAARLLSDLGPGAHHVALRTSSTRAIATAALGVLRAGMVLVPVDHTAPDAYARGLLEDIGARCLLGPSDSSLGVDAIDPLEPGTVSTSPVDVPIGSMWSIAFTSGSTGIPKGIMLPVSQLPTRQSVAIWTSEETKRLRGGAIAHGTAAPVAGMMLQYLAAGATIAAYELERGGVHGIGPWLAESDINGIAFVPTLLREILAETPADVCFRGLRIAAVFGETMTWEDAAALRAHLPDSTPLFNTFGLTETGGFAVFAVMSDTPVGTGPLPIGWALPGRTVQLVDPDGQPVADGEAGEIVVDSETNALGYWKRPELTASVFTELADGRRRVATGDRGRRREDGILEHLGRLDHVVKVAGNRIELEHVERALRALPGVGDAAASTYVDRAGDTRLRAHVVARDGQTVEPTVLREELAQRLPPMMLPDWIDVIDQLPRLGSGKVDRSALPPRQTREPAIAGFDKQQLLEANLRAIWSDVLGVDEIPEDATFISLGGDSLRAARVFTQIERRLGIDASSSALLSAPTIRILAAALSTNDNLRRCIVPVRIDGDLPPLFVVHGVDGGIWWAAGLADALGSRQPVYGFEAAWFDASFDSRLSLQQIAARYVEELVTVNPDGPVLLYGVSLGGVIAFEMASQLESAGREVTLLAFGDTPAPGPVEAPPGGWEKRPLPERIRARWQGEKQRLFYWGAGLTADRFRALRMRWTRRRPSRSALETARSRHIGIASYRYARTIRGESGLATTPPGGEADRSVKVVSAPALLVRQREIQGTWDRGWQRYLTQPVAVVELDGRHMDQWAEENHPTLAAVLSTAIEERLAERSVAASAIQGG